MKSLRELRNELLGIRIAAVNMSLWQSNVALNDQVRTALNDAIRTYPFRVNRVYTSVSLPLSGYARAVIPDDVQRVIGVFAVGDTTSQQRQEVPHFNVLATPETMIIDIPVAQFAAPTNVEIVYEAQTKELSPEYAVIAPVLVGDTRVVVTGGVPAVEYKAPGLIEIASGANSISREIVWFSSLGPSSFEGLIRGFGGTGTVGPTNWTVGDIISPIAFAPDEAYAVWAHAAQAELYHFWLRQRALYEQLPSWAGLHQMEVADILGLIRSEEDRADRRYAKVKTPIAPGRAKTKGRQA